MTKSEKASTREQGQQTDATADELQNADYAGQIEAIGKAQAVIEFNMDGTIITANANFLGAVGYSLDEIQGEHHGMFVDDAFRASVEYEEFWAKLNRGEYEAAEYKRVGKGGKEIWIQASYNPILDLNGKPFKVVKYATDVTAQVMQRTEIAKMKEASERDAKTLQEKVDRILSAVEAASKGDLTKTVGVSGTDAIGRLGDGLTTFLQDLRGSIGKIAKNAESLATSSGHLTAASEDLRASAEQTKSQANATASTAEQVNASTASVASAAEELNASVGEIAKSATSAAHVAAQAVEAARSTNKHISLLGDSSAEIGGVIKVIAAIAQQTNLLALNATIEAARAGDAGKGFAVVANEVKELAKETASATENISQRIEAIQMSTKNAVEAIAEISGIITQINELQGTIAGAVEEQNATTAEIGRSISEASQGSSSIVTNIVEVAKVADTATERVNQTREAAVELSEMSAELQTLVEQFQY